MSPETELFAAMIAELDATTPRAPKLAGRPEGMAEKDWATNDNGDTGKFRMLLLAQAEHDDPEQAPTYAGKRLVLVGGVYLTEETAEQLCHSEAA